jgi:uncharacterized protein (DUF934 family)
MYMPTLLKTIDGTWQAGPPETHEWQPVDDWEPGASLVLKVDDEPAPDHQQASAIAIEFPAFNDGRALSLAVLMRTRFGYAGEIRAIGAVHEDLLHYMIRCGFTCMELADDRDPQVALNLLQPYSHHYQSSVAEPAPLFRRANRGA